MHEQIEVLLSYTWLITMMLGLHLPLLVWQSLLVVLVLMSSIVHLCAVKVDAETRVWRAIVSRCSMQCFS
eukprot:249248-Amphidinium_carterae.1